jgi:preprotein translocase subunit SecE
MAKTAVAPSANGTTGMIETVKSWPERIKAFYQDVRTETKKVTTPTRKEVQATTVVVIVTVFLFAGYFWIVDLILNNSLERLFRYFIRK